MQEPNDAQEMPSPGTLLMRAVGIVLAISLVVYAFASQMIAGLNPDMSWLLTVGERLLAGQQFYIDIYEPNPPMSALMYLPGVALAHLVGLPSEPIVVGGILLLAILSLWLTITILRRAGYSDFGGAFWLVSLAALVVLPGNNFGEREHIAVIAMLPLVAVSAVRSSGKSPGWMEIVLAGLGAGLTMTIKPHFAIAILSLAGWSAAQARSWRPVINSEHILAGLILVAYGIATWIWFPGFFSKMLPLTSAAYLPDRAPLLALVASPALWPIWLMLTGLLVLYRREMLSRPYGQLLAAALGFVVVYFIQGKGFIYHALPAVILTGMVFAQCFIVRNATGRMAALPVALAIILIAGPGAMDIRGDAQRRELAALLTPLGPGLKIANVTSHLGVASPLHRDLGATLVNSEPFLWITLGAARQAMASDDPAIQQRMDELQAAERKVVLDDLVRTPPDIILMGGDGFDWQAWAQQDHALATILDGYRVIATLDAQTGPLRVLQRADLPKM